MIMRYYSCDEIRKIEENAIKKGITIEKLMDNVGEMSAEFIKNNLNFEKIVFIAGTGNNGGDVLSTAFHLFNVKPTDYSVFVVGSEDKLKEDPYTFLKFIKDIKSIPITFIEDESTLSKLEEKAYSADLIVVGIFGTGFHGHLPVLVSKIIDIVNNTDAKKVSIDIPSGINSDTGEFEKAIRSDFTLTTIGMKLAFQKEEVLKMCGHIEVLDIFR